jgi:micrococcal nuclease
MMRRALLLLVCICIARGLAGPGPLWPAEGDRARVRAVVDGDTVILQDGRHLRYIGIDTPEVRHGDTPGEPLGEEARRFNRELVQGQTVRLEFDQERQDRHGRLLAYVYLADGRQVNAALIEAGLAFCLPDAVNRRHAEPLLQVQRAAMDAGRGMWQGWREPAGARYMGNSRSRRFHTMACPGSRRLHRENRVLFHSQWEAFKAGFAPARDCL